MHAAILVIGEDYEAALAPFSENDGDNPDGRWDWYQLGGRYRGRLLVKQGAFSGVGKPGTFDNEPRYPGGVDQARWGDIDFAALRGVARQLAEEQFAMVLDPIKRRDLWLTATEVEEALADPEKWINQHSAPITAFGVVKDGRWYDRYRRIGEYTEQGGWPDTYFDSKSEEEWQAEVGALLADLAPDAMVSIVDCHD